MQTSGRSIERQVRRAHRPYRTWMTEIRGNVRTAAASAVILSCVLASLMAQASFGYVDEYVP
jgi:hypothetical protein